MKTYVWASRNSPQNGCAAIEFKIMSRSSYPTPVTEDEQYNNLIWLDWTGGNKVAHTLDAQPQHSPSHRATCRVTSVISGKFLSGNRET